MSIAILLLLVVLFFAFVFAVVKAAPNWRWYHITVAVIAMLLAIVLLFPTAGVLKSRQAWHKLKEDLEGRVEQVKKEYQRLQYGDYNDPTAPPGLKSLSLELSKLGIEAGRRWRNLEMVGIDQATGQITLRKDDQAIAAPGADPAAAANPTGPLVPEELIIYGFAEEALPEPLFAEGMLPRVDRPMPTVYLGEFKVDASVGNSVTISPTFPLQPRQQELITRGGAKSWSLYELLPLDGHDPFIAEGSAPSEDDELQATDNIFGRVDDKLVNILLKNASPETIKKYKQDGQKGNPEDPSTKWVAIRFDKKFDIDVDNNSPQGALEGGFFDNLGRAIDSRLQGTENDGRISFSPGEMIFVKEEAAKELTDVQKVATQVQTYYVRPLNDYRYILRHIRMQIAELDTRIEELNYEKQVLEQAIASTVAMLEKGQIEKLKLEQDLGQYQVETAAIKAYHGEVREQLRVMNEEASSLYRSNFELLEQIRQQSSGDGLTDT